MSILFISSFGVWLITAPKHNYLRLSNCPKSKTIFAKQLSLENNFLGLFLSGIAVVLPNFFLPVNWAMLLAVVLAPAGLFLGGMLPRKSKVEDKIKLQELANVCEIIATGLEAGLPLRTVIKGISELEISGISDVFKAISLRVELGSSEIEVWKSLEEYPDLGDLARDISLALESGLVIADTCRNYAQKFQENLQDKAIQAARKVGVKSVLPLMCCYLPAFMLVGILPIIGGNLPQLSI